MMNRSSARASPCAPTEAAPVTIDVADCDLDEIGQWPHSLAGGRASQPKSVRDIVATEPIWDRSELPREELTTRIIAAGHRIGHDYALSAMTFTDGRISLDNGGHRWAVAAELGIKRVPVEMIYQSPEPAWEWSWR